MQMSRKKSKIISPNGGFFMYSKYFKRLIDILLSLIGMPFLIIPIIVISIAIKLDSPGPIFFKQRRVGINKKSFYILKFRTMRMDTPVNIPTEMLEDADHYITRIGKFLRKTSLDEIPQIFNILVGHMSVIGPRPALWNQYKLIKMRDDFAANSIRPGLTGWAQINGRDTLSIEEKVHFDSEYVENMSFSFDLHCFWETLAKVVKQEGIVEGRVERVEIQHNETLRHSPTPELFTSELTTELLTRELLTREI